MEFKKKRALPLKILSGAIISGILLTTPQVAVADDNDSPSSPSSTTGRKTSDSELPDSYSETREDVPVEFEPIPHEARSKIFYDDSDDLQRSIAEIEIPTYTPPRPHRRQARTVSYTPQTDITEYLPAPTLRTVIVTPTPEPDPAPDVPPPPGAPAERSVGAPPPPPGGEVKLEDMATPYSGTIGEKVVQVAKTKMGTAYIWGAAGPSNFDCSGLVQWSYKQAGINLPRVSWDQIKAGKRIPLSEAKPGDIIGYSNGGHVALYIGDGKVIHAPETGDVVKISPVGMMPVYSVTRIAQ